MDAVQCITFNGTPCVGGYKMCVEFHTDLCTAFRIAVRAKYCHCLVCADSLILSCQFP